MDYNHKDFDSHDTSKWNKYTGGDPATAVASTPATTALIEIKEEPAAVAAKVEEK